MMRIFASLAVVAAGVRMHVEKVLHKQSAEELGVESDEVFELSPADDNDNFQCARGGCRSSRGSGEQLWSESTTDFLHFGDNDPEVCMRTCLRKHKDTQSSSSAAGKCSCQTPSNGNICNIFIDNGWDWASRTMVNRGAPLACTRVISSATAHWERVHCTSNEAGDEYAQMTGMEKTTELSLQAGFEVAAVSFAATISMSSSISRSTTMTTHMKPERGKTRCLWQWTFNFMGVDQKWVVSKTPEFKQTDGPYTKPKCLPYKFDEAYPDHQHCKTGGWI